MGKEKVIDMDKVFGLSDNYNFDFHLQRDDLTAGKYIDDNALFLYYMIALSVYDTKDACVAFLHQTPFEWDVVTFNTFLIGVVKKYNLNIYNITTFVGAIEDDYLDHIVTGIEKLDDTLNYTDQEHQLMRRLNVEEKCYKGAYEWIKEEIQTNPKSRHVKLFNKFIDNKATIDDLEQALIYASRMASIEPTEEDYLSKELFRSILTYTHFSISVPEPSGNKLKADIKKYIDAFINNELIRNTYGKYVREVVKVEQSKNVYTFNRHKKLFDEYLNKMRVDYGDEFLVTNIFEDMFPNLCDISSDYLRNRFSKRTFLYMHILFAYRELGLLKIHYASTNWGFYEDTDFTYQAKVKLLPSFYNEDLVQKLHFDPDKSRLYVQGNEIKLLKFKDEYHTLRIIFEDTDELSKEWFFSEIREKVDKVQTDDKKYYNAIYQLKLKLKQVGIDDLFITTKQSVKINSKYIDKS